MHVKLIVEFVYLCIEIPVPYYHSKVICDIGGLRPCWSTSWMSRSVGDSKVCKDSVFTEKPLSTLARQQSGSNEGKQDQAAVQRLLGKTIGTNQAKAKPGDRQVNKMELAGTRLATGIPAT